MIINISFQKKVLLSKITSDILIFLTIMMIKCRISASLPLSQYKNEAVCLEELT